MSGGSEWEEDSNDGTQVFAKGSSSVFQPISSQSETPIAPHQEIPQQNYQGVNHDQQALLAQAHGESYSGWQRLQNYNHTHPVYSLPVSESCHTATLVQQPSSQKLSRNMIRPSSDHRREARNEMPQYKHRYMDKTPHSSLYDSSDVLGFKQQLQKVYTLMKTPNIWENKVVRENSDHICNDDMDISPDHSVPDTFDNEAGKRKGLPPRICVASWVEELNEKFSTSNLENREDRGSYQTQPFSESARARTQNDTEKAIEKFLRLQRLPSSQAKPVSHETPVQEVATPSVQNNEADHLRDRAKSSSDLNNSDSNKDDSDSDQDRAPSRSCSMGALLGHMRNLASASAKDESPKQPKKGNFSYEKSECNPKSPIQSPALLPKQKPSSSSSNSPVLSPPRHLRAQRTSVIASKDDQSYQLKKHSSNDESQSSYMYPTQAEGQLRTQKSADHVSRYESSSCHQKKTHCNEESPQCNPKSLVQLPGKKAYNSGRAVLDRILSGEFKSHKVSSQSAVKSCSSPGTVDQTKKSKPDDTPNSSRQHVPCTQKQQLSSMSDDDISNKLVDKDVDDLIFEDLEEMQRVMETINSDDVTNSCTNKKSPNPLSQEKEKSSDTAEENISLQRYEAEKTQKQVSDIIPSSFSKGRQKELRVDTTDMITTQTDGSEKVSKQLHSSTTQNTYMKSTVQRGRTSEHVSDSSLLSSSKEKEVGKYITDKRASQTNESKKPSKQMSDSTPCISSEKKKVRVDTAHQITEQTVEPEKTSKEHQTKDDHSDKSNKDSSEEKQKKHKHKKKKSSSKKSKHSDERERKRKGEDREHDQKDRKKSKTSEKSSGNLSNGNIEKESPTSNKHCNLSSKNLKRGRDSESSIDGHAPESNIESRDASLRGSSKGVCKDRFYFVTKNSRNLDNVKVEDMESDSAVPQLMDGIIKGSDSPESDDFNIHFKDEPMDEDWHYNVDHVDESDLKKSINSVLEVIDNNTSSDNPYGCLYDLLNNLDIGVWTCDNSPYLYEVEVNFRRLILYIANDYELCEVDKYIEDIQQNMKIPLKDFLKHIDYSL